MNINKLLIIIFCTVIAASAVIIGIMLFREPAAPEPVIRPAIPDAPLPLNLTVIKPPDQTEPTRPDGFPDPEENWIKLPESANLAEGKTVDAGEVTEVYAAANTVDGDLTSYWESKGLPADITIDLAGEYNIQTIAVRLNPAPIWEPRNQNFGVHVSTDGKNFTEIVPDKRYDFDPDSGNIVRIDFDPVLARYVRLAFTAKSSGRSNGAQAAEIQVFE